MRQNVWMVLSLAVVTWAAVASRAAAQGASPEGRRDGGASISAPAAHAAPAPGAPGAGASGAAPPVEPGRMEQLIKLWAMQSGKLKNLDVTMTRIDEDPAWGAPERYEGRAMFQSPNLAWLEFKRVGVNDKKQKILLPHERIVCTGSQVWQYRCVERQIRIFDLDREARERALQQGPLPFLFNFNENEALTRYMMALLKEDEKSYIIKIIPRLPIDQEEFTSALIRLDKTFLLPTQIHLSLVGDKSKKLYTLTSIRENEGVADENFKPQIVAGWKVVRNDQPAAGAPAAGTAPPNRDPAAGRPALRRATPAGRLR